MRACERLPIRRSSPSRSHSGIDRGRSAPARQGARPAGRCATTWAVMDLSILVGVLAGVLVPLLLLAAFQLFSERLPKVDRPVEGRLGLVERTKAGGRRLVAFVFSAPRRQRGRTEQERSIAHARPMAVDVRANWDDEGDLGPSLASGNGRRGLVAVGPGPTEVDEEWEPAEELAALGSRMRPGDAPLRVRVITTGVDGRTTILDDEAPTVSCPRCGYRHSAAASYCRRCGYSQSNRPTTRWQGTSADDKAVARRGQR